MNIKYKDYSAETPNYSLKILHYVVDDARLKIMTLFPFNIVQLI